MDYDNPIDRYDYEARFTRLGIESVKAIREGQCDREDLIETLRALALCARDLAVAAEAFANSIDKPQPQTDTALFATLERVARISGGIDVRA
jgi:hypothetical protein